MKYVRIIGSDLLTVFGALWLCVEAINYFFDLETSNKIKEFWLFLLIGLFISIFRVFISKYRLWHWNKFSFIVEGRDITVELVIGDIFKQQGPVIVGSNTEFIVGSQISKNSIQGQFCKKYFPSKFPSIRTVESQISDQVKKLPCKLGTTVTIKGVTIEGATKIGYFCAIADMNNSGVAQSNVENLRISLGELWNYLSGNAEKDIINIPILGSGFSRITAKREELVIELLHSFFAAISESSFCEGMRVVIKRKDVSTYNIDIEELAKIFEYACKYSLSESTRVGHGIGISK